MSITVYNATLGKYVTTLTASAGAQKQVSTASIKSKAGGQAAPLTPNVTSVKVSLSTAAKAVLAGTTKLKASELFTRMQQPGYSPGDLTGVTLYVDSNLKEIMPPAVPGSRKTFDLDAIKSSGTAQLQLSMADMGLNPAEFNNYNTAPHQTNIQWYGLDDQGAWVAVNDNSLPTQFDQNGNATTSYASLSADIKSKYKSLRADFSRVPNYEKLLTLLTPQGGRKLMDLRAANDGPVKIDEATFQQIQNDMRSSLLAKAGASQITEKIITVANQGSLPINLSGNPGDVVKWFKQTSTNGKLDWQEVTDDTLPNALDQEGKASITIANMPSALSSASVIKAEIHAPSLLGVLSNLSLDFPVTKDSSGVEKPVAEDMDPAILARFRQMVDSNQATKITIGGQSSARTLTPDLVSKLGPKTLARYAGELKIDATARDLMTEQNWSNLQTLNNYRNISINLDYGVPSTLNAGQTLSDVMSKMTYQQFMGGYNLLSSISIKSAPVDLVPTNYDASTKTQTFQFSGLFLNGDSVKLTLLGTDGKTNQLNVGPLILPNGASPKQQANALFNAVDTALRTAAKDNATLSGIDVSLQDNKLLFAWPSGVNVPLAAVKITSPATGSALTATTYDARSRTQRISVSNNVSSGDQFNLSLTNSDGIAIPISLGPLNFASGADKKQKMDAIVAQLRNAIPNNGTLDLNVKADGDDLVMTWNKDAPKQMPPVTFLSSTRAQQGNPTFGVELNNVPPSAVESMRSYPQVYGLNVRGTADQFISNSDKLNTFITSGFVKTVQLIDAKTGDPVVAPSGQLSLTAAQAARSIPLLEKVGPGIISISDKKSSPASYVNFTNAAANNLVGGLRIVGTGAEIQNALQGITALTRMGKIATLVMTGANGKQTSIDNFDSTKLAALIVSLRKGG